MKTLFHDIRTGWRRALRHAGRARARRELLGHGDRTLADAGFSRELLEAGVGAWPWRHDGDPAAVAEAMRTARAERVRERQAIGELKACSDADLADLGIARADIARAVREGRTTDAIGSAPERAEEPRRAA